MTSDHVKIWANNSQWIGLVVKPYTYRVDFAPSFFPRFSVGDMTGVDQARWRSWVQSRFDEGEGQMYWSSSESTNRYAQGHLVQLGEPIRMLHQPEPFQSGRGRFMATHGPLRADAIAGDIGPALYPQMTSMGPWTHSSVYMSAIANMAVYFTDRFPTFVMEWSDRPALWHWKSAWIFSSVDDPVVWSAGAIETYANKLGGLWSPLWRHSAQVSSIDVWISDAVLYSGVPHVAITSPRGNSFGQLHVYGPVSGTGTTPSIMQIPVYGGNYSQRSAVQATRLAVYDEKLWRSVKGKAYYMEPCAGTVPTTWEEYVPGDANQDILNMKEFNGRLYFGKANALWTFDAGRLYRVEDFSAYTDAMNFQLMRAHRGYLYFNIKHMLFRLSTAGTLEQVQTYPTAGVLIDAASVGNDLYYIAREPGFYPSTEVWIFDPEMGANFRYLDATSMAQPKWGSPRSLGAAYGLLLMTPISHTLSWVQNSAVWSGGYTISTPIMGLDPTTPVQVRNMPNYAEDDTWLATSMIDFGLPTLPKIFNRLTVDYELEGRETDKIDVYYCTGIRQHTAVKQSFLWNGVNAIGTDDGKLNDGDITTGNNDAFGTTYPFWVVGLDTFADTQSGEQDDRTDVAGFSFIFAHSGGIGPKNPDELFRVYMYNDGWQLRSDITDIRISYEQGSKHGQPSITYLIVTVRFPTGRRSRYVTAATKGVVANTGMGADTTCYNWFALKALVAQPDDAPRESSIIKGASFADAHALDWELLGSIAAYEGSIEKLHETRKALQFPKGLVSPQIMLKFDFKGSSITRPSIKRYEIEWMPAPSKYRVYNFTVPIAENVEQPDLTVRANAISVAATIYSFAGAGIPYVCQVPWPGTHTVNGLISITTPGGVVPSLRDDNFDNSSADIPVQIDEV